MTRPSKKLSKQLNKGQDGLGNNKKRGLIAEDIQKIIEAHNALARAMQNEINQLTSRLDDTSIILQGISNVVGVEKVAEAAKAVRIKLLEDNAAEQGANVAKAYSEGRLMKTFEVNDKSLVVTTMKKSDGSPMYPTKSYLPFGNFKPEVQAILLGKKIGDVEQLPTEGGTIEILEIYEECEPATSGYIAPVEPIAEGQIQEAEFTVVPAVDAKGFPVENVAQ
jgi:hypothetical protein